MIASRNGQEWSLEIPCGQWKAGKDGTVLLQRHLWCPDDLRGQGTEMRWVSCRRLKSQDKHFEYLNNFANISSYIISVFFLLLFDSNWAFDWELKTIYCLVWMFCNDILYGTICHQWFYGLVNYTKTWAWLFSIVDVRQFSQYRNMEIENLDVRFKV